MTRGNDLINSDNRYFYNGRMSLGLDIYKDTKFRQVFNNVFEGVFYSNPVEDYKQCVKECTGLVNEVTQELLETSGNQYQILWESNPAVNPNPDYVSKSVGLQPWTDNEILRFFIVNSSDIDEKKVSIVTPMIVSVCSFNKVLLNTKSSPVLTH